MKSALILEDVTDVRNWLTRLVGDAIPGILITEASLISEAKQIMSTQSFELALIDVNLPDGNGIDLIPELRKSNPSVYCVVSTIFDDDDNILHALRAGAQGYLLKDQPEERLKEAIRRILIGEPPLSPRVALRVLDHFREGSAAKVKDTGLTQREKDILTLIAKGLSRAEVAVAFAIGDSTVASHISAIYRKLDISSRSEATLEALRLGLIKS